MSQEKKDASSDKVSGWDTAILPGKGVQLRFLSPGAGTGQFKTGPWVTLTAKHCEALAAELLQEAKKI